VISPPVTTAPTASTASSSTPAAADILSESTTISTTEPRKPPTSHTTPMISRIHNTVLFVHRPINEWPMFPGHCTIGANRIDMKYFLSRIRIPSPPTDFEGREVHMNTVIRHLLDRRLVSLVGEYGVGKSAVASAVCKYLADRDVFADGIIYVKVKGVHEYSDFIRQMKESLSHGGVNNVVTKRMQELLALQQHQQQSNTNTVTAITTHASSSSSLAHHFHITTNTNTSNTTTITNQQLLQDEALIFQCLESYKVLLVLDNLDDLLADYGEAVTDFRLFLSRLFETCNAIKVLNVSIDTLQMHNIQVGYGIVEYSVPLGPLTLHNTLRLFARLAPSLTTIHDKIQFVETFQPPNLMSMIRSQPQSHSSLHSREINNTTIQILDLFGEGHPAKIVHMASESTPESIEDLKLVGTSILRASLPYYNHTN